MRHRGIFSAEAGVSFIIFLALLAIVVQAAPRNAGQHGWERLLAMQKISDLLIVWQLDETNEKEMVEDANALLGVPFEIEIGGRKISAVPMGGRAEYGEKVSLEILSMRNGMPEKIRALTYLRAQ